MKGNIMVGVGERDIEYAPMSVGGAGYGFGGGFGGIAPFGLFGLAGIGGRNGLFGGNDCGDIPRTGTLANDVLLLNQIDSKVTSATTPIALSLAGIKESMESAAILGAIGGVKDEVCDVKSELSAFASNTNCQFMGVNHRFDDVFKEIECAKTEIIQANRIAELEARCRVHDESRIGRIEDSLVVVQGGLGNVIGALNNLPTSVK